MKKELFCKYRSKQLRGSEFGVVMGARVRDYLEPTRSIARCCGDSRATLPPFGSSSNFPL
jgi:hypothetical protein